jgi:hypothetical protein
MWRGSALALALVAVQSSVLHAQPLGYGLAGPAGFNGFFGSRHDSFHVAGGGEVLIRDLAGPSVEFGFFDRFITLSLNGVVHIPPRDARLRPFATAGYTKMGIGDGEGEPFDEWNAGGGGDFWFSKRQALRFEVRDHVRSDHRGNVHYWSVRGGIVFR